MDLYERGVSLSQPLLGIIMGCDFSKSSCSVDAGCMLELLSVAACQPVCCMDAEALQHDVPLDFKAGI